MAGKGRHMNRTMFKNFKESLLINGMEDKTLQAMGYLWINCTERQIDELYDLAIAQGYKPDEKGAVHIGIYRLSKSFG